MNNNYYNNPYYNQTGFYNQFQQPMQQPVAPMTYVNGLEGAKSYWMAVNSVAYLRDNNDDSILYEKRTDGLGKYQMRAYKLTELQVENNNFKLPDNSDRIQTLESKIDAIYNILASKGEVSNNE